MDVRDSDRLKKLPPYLFVEIDKAKRKAVSQGRDIIDFGIGDPDMPTPDFIIEALNKALKDPANHHYALDAGLPRLREAIARWYLKRFNVELDPHTEVCPLIGSKEGIAHLPLAIVNPGEKVLVPQPSYPPYRSSSIFAGAEVVVMPLLEENDFLPDLSKIQNARLIFVNYPNNPTSACADTDFYSKLVNQASKRGIIVASDLAYSEIYFDQEKPTSFLEIEGAKDIGIEFHSLSKTFNMTGWRIGWVSGNRDIISALAKVKSNIDSGVFQAIQIAAVAALESDGTFTQKMRNIYQERRDVLIEGLTSIGLEHKRPRATFYVWIKVPKGNTSTQFSKLLLEEADVIATPGVGFGDYGEGFIRMALTVPVERIKEAVKRIKKVL